MPRRQHTRGAAGFTLIELMMTTALFAFIAIAIFSAWVGGSRMLRQTFAEAELSVRTRELRDRLLFHAAPAHDGTVWAGLLSVSNSWANGRIQSPVEGSKILLRGTALKSRSDGNALQDQEIQLLFDRTTGNPARILFSEDRFDERWPSRWLQPAGIDFYAGQTQLSDVVTVVSNNLFYIDITARESAGGLEVRHDERIVVPIFRAPQDTSKDGTAGLPSYNRATAGTGGAK